MRHMTTKLKPQVADHIASWRNYVNVSYILSLRTSVAC